MSFKAIVFAIGDFIESTFGLFVKGSNTVNYTFITVGLVLLVWWILQLVKFKKEAAEQGTME